MIASSLPPVQYIFYYATDHTTVHKVIRSEGLPPVLQEAEVRAATEILASFYDCPFEKMDNKPVSR